MAKAIKLINNVLIILNAHYLMIFSEIARGKLGSENLAYCSTATIKKEYFMLFGAGTIVFYIFNLIVFLLRKVLWKYKFERPNFLPCVIVQTLLCVIMLLIVMVF